MQTNFDSIYQQIMDDSENSAFISKGYKPLYRINQNSKIILISQAPSLSAQISGVDWFDRSGILLRKWLGLDEDAFWNTDNVAILPMDFFFPGFGKGGDLPPRKDFASKWHPKLIANLPKNHLKVLIGQYSQNYYLPKQKARTLTQAVKEFESYLPEYFPLPHPSGRNGPWQAHNPWFVNEVVPRLQQEVKIRLDY